MTAGALTGTVNSNILMSLSRSEDSDEDKKPETDQQNMLTEGGEGTIGFNLKTSRENTATK